jgi:branched-chain amino acid aminotransferase
MPILSDNAWANGAIIERERAAPSVASSSFHMGTGVFDGLMAYWNDDHWYLHLSQEHLERFVAGCTKMRLPFEWSVDDMEAGIYELLDTCARTTQYIRPIAFRAAPEILLVPSQELPVTVCMFAVEAPHGLDSPLSCGLSSFHRVSSKAIPVAWKICGAYANSFLAQTEALDEGYDTALLVNQEGNLSEASVSNLFLIQSETLVTPALSADVFPGLTRRLMIDFALREGIAVEERDVEVAEIESCEAAFLCSTLMELRPLERIGLHEFRDHHHAIFRSLRALFRELTRT